MKDDGNRCEKTKTNETRVRGNINQMECHTGGHYGYH